MNEENTLIKWPGGKTREIKYIESMKKLGNMFKVQVKVAAATILKGGE